MSTENTSSEPLREFWHGTRLHGLRPGALRACVPKKRLPSDTVFPQRRGRCRECVYRQPVGLGHQLFR